MLGGDEPGFELAGGDIDPIVQQAAEELRKRPGIALRRNGMVRNALIAEEAADHASASLDLHVPGNVSFAGGGFQRPFQGGAIGVEFFVRSFMSQRLERRLTGRHRAGVSAEGPRLVDRPFGG